MPSNVRVATFNMLHGRSLLDGRVDSSRFADAVRDLDADVLGLQEVDRDQARSSQADFTALAAQAMGATAHRFVAALHGAPGSTWIAATGIEQPGTASYGIALLSRYPVSSWQVIRLAPLRPRFPMWLPGPRKVIIVREEPRVAVTARIATPAGPLTVATTHLSFVPGWSAWQLHQLRRALAAVPDPVLLMGDLNMGPGAAARLTGYRPLVLGQPTFPAQDPRRQLDHVLLRGGFAPVTDSYACELPLSDHRALVVDLQA